MKRFTSIAVGATVLAGFALSSCDTPTGQGAGIGAVTGSLIGAAATGNVRGAAVGGLIGAGTGALIGAAVEADQRGYYEGHEVAYYPYGSRTETPGFVRSPYPPHALINTRGIPRGALVRDPSSGRVFRKP